MQQIHYDCFLSYRNADYADAEKIYRRLTGAGFKVWWDKIYLEAGMRWHQEIEEHCEASRVVLPLLTPDDGATRMDALRDVRRGADIIPLLLRGEWEKGWRQRRSRSSRATCSNLASATDADWDRLFARIRKLLDEPKPERHRGASSCSATARSITSSGRDLTYGRAP